MSNWLYSDERMNLRAEVIGLLFKKFGGDRIDQAGYSTEDIYSAAHDWVSQGNPSTDGVIHYFTQHYVLSN